MKTRVLKRIRPLRSLAFVGVASFAALPVSVAFAGGDDPVEAASGLEAEIGENLLAENVNAPVADLIPTGTEGTLAITDKQVIPDADDAGTVELSELIGGGEASWYGPRFAGRPTASGETFDPTELTAAHRTLPFGSRVRVTSRRTGKSVIVRINDRGPYHGNRVIDLSEAAAKLIGIKARGRGNVELALLQD